MKTQKSGFIFNTQMMRKIVSNVDPDAAGVDNLITFLLSDEASYISSSSYKFDDESYNS